MNCECNKTEGYMTKYDYMERFEKDDELLSNLPYCVYALCDSKREVVNLDNNGCHCKKGYTDKIKNGTCWKECPDF